MTLNRDPVDPVLFDLAMAMAGEIRPHPLAVAVLQCLQSHTGSAGGAVLLHPEPAADSTAIAAEVYAAIGAPALHALEGKNLDLPVGLLAGDAREPAPAGLPGDETLRHTLALALPELGHLLLFFRETPRQAMAFRRLLAPLLSRFARNLRHDFDSETTARALQQSEARFRSMVESTSDWFWEVDPTGIYTFCNNKVQDLLGYASEEVIGKRPFDFMPPAEAKHIGWTFRDIVANRRPFSNLENVNLHKDGREVVLETSGVPIFDADGSFRGYRGIDRDITLRRQAQEALVKARNEAEAANRAKLLFLSSMSHELRTPLNAILGHAQLIGMQPDLPEGVHTSADEIQQAGASLLAQMNGVLELAGIESGDLDLQIEPLVPAEMLEDCLAANAGAARFVKSPLNCSNACDCCKISADRHALLQVLNQLVANAIKYNRVGGKVTLLCRTVGSDHVRFSVTDEGRGIAPADQAQLFVPFNRLGAEKGRIEGAGLGLSIARRLIEGMDGRIGVDSAEGRGSTFWIELPIASQPECADCPPPPMPGATVLQGARVLVAEDYAPNQILLRMQLASLGYHADIVADGAAALEAWAGGRYDVILADLNMPVMDGLALARAVRARETADGRRTPILCITAADHAAELRHCHEAGMDDTLTKPILLEALRAKLERWIVGRATATPVDPQAADDAILDLACLYDILGDTNEAQARELVATFLRSAASGLDRLAAGATAAMVAQEMHKQKSSARTVGALRYAKLAAALETSAKDAGEGDFEAPLTALRGVLEEVESVHGRLVARPPAETQVLEAPLAGHGALLVVDDDPVVQQQMAAMLATLGVKEVLTASNGLDALNLLSERNGSLETLICDLSMPTMDGVELLRRFGRTGFQGGVILMSGADEKVLNTAGKLADLQGLRVLGQVQKPVTPAQMTGLLSRPAAPRIRRRQSAAPLQVSPQSIRDGIARDEFTIWFQPKVDAASLEPVGVEALARWQHPARGILSPDTFIGVAEREGLVGELSQILTSRALMEGARLHDTGFPLTIAINLSGRWLDDLQLPDFIYATTQAAGLRPADILLEVTETGVMKELATALEVLTRLRLKGFGLSIDDFGIGYSSFEQLDRIPFTELKLDRSFVSKGEEDATAYAILQGCIDMARRMDLTTVAEGVETEGQLELVRMLGCDRIQGYLIARPMPTDDLIAWLRARPGSG
ncbi:MAG: EAL domain-containing protein [Thiobacillus sp.]|nr:EAL domain-containing protein [Thiobacillus sp.]